MANCDYYCKTCKTCIKVLQEGVNVKKDEKGDHVCLVCETALKKRTLLHD